MLNFLMKGNYAFDDYINASKKYLLITYLFRLKRFSRPGELGKVV